MGSFEETALLSYRIVSKRSKTLQLDLVAVSKYILPMGIAFKASKYKVQSDVFLKLFKYSAKATRTGDALVITRATVHAFYLLTSTSFVIISSSLSKETVIKQGNYFCSKFLELIILIRVLGAYIV